MSANVSARHVALSVVVPAIRKVHPDGRCSRAELLAECNRAGIPVQPWLCVAATDKHGKAIRGVYDVTQFFEAELPAAGKQQHSYAAPEEKEKDDTRTDAEVLEFVRGKFAMMDWLVHSVAIGELGGLIISGPPGVGKTWGATAILDAARNVKADKMVGFSRATGLFKALWDNRDPECVLVIDDCDSVFNDEVALNLLKGALETSGKREVQWRSEKTLADELGNEVDRCFEFKGRVVFVTNLNFDELISAQSRVAVHLGALRSRPFYFDCNLTKRETLARVLDVARNSTMLAKHTAKERERITEWIRSHHDRMIETSIRSVVKLSQLLSAVHRSVEPAKADEHFERIARETLCRR